MKLDLLDFNEKKLEIKDIDILTRKVNKLLGVTGNNLIRWMSKISLGLYESETFSSMFTEGEISSRKKIKDLFNKPDDMYKPKSDDNIETTMTKGFYSTYLSILLKPNFSTSSLFNIYSTLSINSIEESNKLKDTEMFRSEDVFISSNKLGSDRKGAKPEKIKGMLDSLWIFLGDNSYDIYLRAIIGHIYFEYIHPFYDYNGRTGRFIPLWLFTANGRAEEMMYFATATGNYRDTYLKLFRKYISDNGEINLDRFVSKVLDLLILNREQYTWYKKIETSYLNTTKKNFTPMQKDLIWILMIKYEIQGNASSWNELSKEDFNFIEKSMNASQFSREASSLKEAGIIDISNTRPPKYKLFNYTLFGLDKDSL